MLDTYRFVLATFVVQAHTWAKGSGPLSQHAVFSFYVLSGFLMTLILNQTYGFGPSNFARFWMNRALRLYPAYFIVIGLTVLHIVLIGPLGQLYPMITIPTRVRDVLANVTMFGITWFDFSQLASVIIIPNAWSLSVELFCYLLLSIFFAKTPGRALMLLAIGLIVTGIEVVRVTVEVPTNYDFQNHYGVLQAGLIPFAAGSIAYFCRRLPGFGFNRTAIWVLLALWTVNCVLAHYFDYHRFVSSIYVAAAINFLLVPIMFNHDETAPKNQVVKILGGIAYPIFVAHILVASLLFRYFKFGGMSFALLVATLIVTILFSLAIHLLVERRIEAYRSLIKRMVTSSYAGKPRVRELPD